VSLSHRMLGYAFLMLVVLARTSVAVAQERISYGRDLVVPAGETLDEVVCFFCMVRVEGAVKGDVVAIGAGIEVRGRAEEVVALGGSVRLLPGATVDGDAVATGGRVERDPQATLHGNAEAQPWFHLPGQRQVFLRGAAGLILGNLLLGFLAFVLARPRRVRRVAHAVSEHPWRTLGVGTGVGLLVLGLYWLGTTLGAWIPYYLLALATLACIPYAVGYAGISVWLGKRIASGVPSALAGFLGALATSLALLVPLGGLVAFLLLAALAFGAAARSLLGVAPLKA